MPPRCSSQPLMCQEITLKKMDTTCDQHLHCSCCVHRHLFLKVPPRVRNTGGKSRFNVSVPWTGGFRRVGQLAPILEQSPLQRFARVGAGGSPVSVCHAPVRADHLKASSELFFVIMYIIRAVQCGTLFKKQNFWRKFMNGWSCQVRPHIDLLRYL